MYHYKLNLYGNRAKYFRNVSFNLSRSVTFCILFKIVTFKIKAYNIVTMVTICINMVTLHLTCLLWLPYDIRSFVIIISSIFWFTDAYCISTNSYIYML